MQSKKQYNTTCLGLGGNKMKTARSKNNSFESKTKVPFSVVERDMRHFHIKEGQTYKLLLIIIKKTKNNNNILM
jgi:hypothetical protein